eukprot:scaffold6219_cov146-Cylindrotheca_fusiformis.AAC.4
MQTNGDMVDTWGVNLRLDGAHPLFPPIEGIKTEREQLLTRQQQQQQHHECSTCGKRTIGSSLFIGCSVLGGVWKPCVVGTAWYTYNAEWRILQSFRS